jgi:hypothetical protein
MPRELHRGNAYADALGRRPPERMSEYFDFERWPEKAERKVTRNELLAVLTQIEKGKQQQRWRSRLWRYLKARVGSGPVHAVEPTQGERERGEITEPETQERP